MQGYEAHLLELRDVAQVGRDGEAHPFVRHPVLLAEGPGQAYGHPSVRLHPAGAPLHGEGGNALLVLVSGQMHGEGVLPGLLGLEELEERLHVPVHEPQQELRRVGEQEAVVLVRVRLVVVPGVVQVQAGAEVMLPHAVQRDVVEPRRVVREVPQDPDVDAVAVSRRDMYGC